VKLAGINNPVTLGVDKVLCDEAWEDAIRYNQSISAAKDMMEGGKTVEDFER